MSDPIDSTEPDELRAEILRLRDHTIGSEAQLEVLTDRVAELEDELRIAGDRADLLQTRLDKMPTYRLARFVRSLTRRGDA